MTGELWAAIAVFCLVVGLYAAIVIWRGLGDDLPRVEAMHDTALEPEPDWDWPARRADPTAGQEQEPSAAAMGLCESCGDLMRDTPHGTLECRSACATPRAKEDTP